MREAGAILSGKNYRFNNQEVLISLAQNLLLNPSFCSDWSCLVNLGSSTWCASVRLREC